ncbi:unnamed protein product [Effrenium voratum]|nr:unnamed protein product [Effrenium voratum]
MLTSKAMMECEQAEAFAHQVEVLKAVPIFSRPDVLEKRLDQLAPGKAEVVARYLSRRDGRVYLRLKAELGWVCTRSCDDLAEAVLAGQVSLEPEKFRTWPLPSPAVAALPPVGLEREAQAPAAEEESEEPEEPEEPEVEGMESEEGTDDELNEEEAEAIEKEEEVKEGEPSVQRAPRRVKKFRVVIGTPVLDRPGWAKLIQNGQKMLQKGETFLADGVYWAKSEQRAYLRMTRSLGWISERSKQDLWRFAVARHAKQPVSRKMARVVAFRGGDAGKMSRLQKDDLIKNSQGRIVSKRASEAAKKRSNENFGKWREAVKRARTDLGISGFAALKKGTELYGKAQEHFRALKK